MKMEYILIEKEITVKKEKNNTIYEINPSPFQIMKKIFKDIEVKETSDRKDKIVRSNWDGNFYIERIKIDFSIKQYSKQDLSYLSLHINGNSNIKLHTLELINDEINKNMSVYYIIIPSYDSISESYCNKIYSKLNKFERKLRELIYDIYTFYYGVNYYEENFNEKLKSNVKIDKTVRLESKSIEKIRQALYELTYNEIIELLFTPKWREEDEQEKLKIIEEINQENLPATEVVKLIDNIKPKSDWERLFLPYMSESVNIQELIDELRNLRNKVAHCKFFGKTDYQRCLELLEILNIEIDNALKAIMKIDFQELNIQELFITTRAISSIIKKSFDSITNTLTKFKESLFPSNFENIFNNIKSIIPSYSLPKYSPKKLKIRNYRKIEANKHYKKRKKGKL